MTMFEIHRYGQVESLLQGRSYLKGMIPPLMTVRCYRVGEILIDSGLSSMASSVIRFAQENQIHTVAITHHHEDHSGNSKVLQDQGLKVLASPQTKQILKRTFKLYPYQHWIWGQAPQVDTDILPNQIETSKYRFQVIPAPGHCDDQVVFYESNEGWLFTGDAFLSDRIKYFRGDEDFQKSLESLKRLVQLDFESLFCAHRPIPKKGKQALQRKLQYFLEIEGKARNLYEKGYSLRQITREVLGKEELAVFLLTLGDVSKINFIRSILVGPTPRKS